MDQLGRRGPQRRFWGLLEGYMGQSARLVDAKAKVGSQNLHICLRPPRLLATVVCLYAGETTGSIYLEAGSPRVLGKPA
jgi:hypothetical protein